MAPERVLDPANQVIAKGDGGTIVAEIQTLLNKHRDKNHQIAVDGKFGPETHGAVAQYQKKSGVDGKDGIVDEKTFAAMKEDGLGNAQQDLTILVAKNDKLAKSLKSMDQANIAMAEGKSVKADVVQTEEPKGIQVAVVPDHLKGAVAQFQDKGFKPKTPEELQQGPGSVPMGNEASKTAIS